MRRNHHEVVDGRLRHLTSTLAVALSCALFICLPLQAGWGDGDYGDIFASQPQVNAKPRPIPRSLASHVHTSSGSPVVKQHSARAVDTPIPGTQARPKQSHGASTSVAKSSFPAASLFPRVSPLGNSSMKNESVKSALGHYRSASNKEKLKRVYKGNRNKLVWSRRERVTSDANAAIRILTQAALQGLNPAEYHVEEILQAQRRGDMTLFDLLLTDNTLRYISHLRDGQYNPSDVDSMWLIRVSARPDIVEKMIKAVKSKKVSRLMKQVEPRNPVYRSLSRHLYDYINIAQSGGWPSFPLRGGSLKPGASGSQVKALRARLAVTDGADLYAPQPSRFDNNLKLAVSRFQRRHGLNDDGVVGGRTRQALAVPVEERIRQISTSMERWRWMPDNLGKEAIVVNIPAFRLYYWKNGTSKLTMRTIVGKAKPELQTPTFTTDLEYMVLNPNWNVPNTIVSEEMAPKAHRWPKFFQDNGYKVSDEAGNVIDPSSVNWGQYNKNNPAPYKVVQARGADGSLGVVKFIFPNQYGVALHDTASKQLFKEEFRAYSHGCVRVEKPRELGAALLGKRGTEYFSSLVEDSEHDRRIQVHEGIAVYTLYMTAWADADQVYFYEDLYRRDRRLVQAKTSKRG